MVGGGCLLVALISVFNTAFNLKLALKVSGSKTALPSTYEEVAGLAAAGILLIGLTLFGGLVSRKFKEAKGRPLVRVGILVGAVGLLVLVFRGLQILALVNTYGSMLAYYATDGDLADVKAELAKKPDREALDEAVHRAGQYNNARALALLLEAGADMRDSSRPPERRSCALMERSYDFVKTALDHGVRPDSCPDSTTAVWSTVRHGRDDAEVARTVTLLIGAGWSATPTPKYDRSSAKALAAKNNWPQTLAALGG